MGWLKESSVSLRFFGDDLVPEEVTALLGCDPTVSATKGSTFTTSAGKSMTAQTGMWRLQQERNVPGDIEAQIVGLFAKLTDDLNVWQFLTSRFESDLFCGLWLDGFNSGQPLHARTISMISDRSLKVDLDIYGDPEQEID
ncbi:DUF4279 domain-containing protein [Qipengyuania gaetbuli]|uniref:DUF4279 domain-containing protein n=1 Tax=Qipengyuania gaetbuli TaxID=266952 RepID=UPI001CD7BB10|nr:DUF4279 domain-containing protein [Qipengyuania gaetbuli]MCA0909825.1 DUF4279 domain-containing protein [Qipengyuania gaetbuli]